ncbi:NUDIX domain-containing protein [Streptomyces sp. NRRL F-2580]|uniref:NUDIX domain-containing protein n=1 Tax=Streptomyces sp. NRRL F-2580 TaxID=1463841 RepID=UPI000B2BD76D|nr:NUDIX hydrolase [Streptomyces sp. NRRL F-2580]
MATPDAAVIVAIDQADGVAILRSEFARHGGEYLFLPGGRVEGAETPEECARRELREEAGITAEDWRPLGSYAITLASTARVHLFEARQLTVGRPQLEPPEADFILSWWSMPDVIEAVREGRFLLPAGPLALMLAGRA